MDLSNFKSTEFVSQYAGLPIDEFLQSASALQQRAQQNTQQLDQLEMMANNIKTLDIDENLKREQLAKIDKQMQDLAASGAYEHATDRIRMEAKNFARNEDLMSASANYAKLQKMKEEAKALGVTDIQLQKIDNALKGYEMQGGSAGKATLEDIGFYKEQNLSAVVDKLLSGWKANKSVIASPDGKGYINTKTNERVTEEELRAEAYKHLASDPQYMRQIEDMAKLNIYNSTMQSTGDPQQAYNVYNNTDSASLNAAQQDVINMIVDPSVAKYSYNVYGSTLSKDPMFEGGGSQKPSLANLAISSKTDFIDFGTIPDNAVDFRNKRTSLTKEIAGLNAELAKLDPDSNEAAAVRKQLNAKSTGLEQLNQVHDKYLSSITDPTRQVGTLLNSAMNSGEYDDIAKGASNYIDKFTAVLNSPKFQAEAAKYGVTPEQISQQLQDKGAMKLYNSGKDRKLFGADFNDWLEENGQTTMPQQYAIDDEDLREKATKSLQTGAVTFYNQSTKGAVTDDEDFRNLPYEVVGVTSMTENGHMYVVRFSDKTENGKKVAGDYAGQTMLVKPEESNIDRVVGEQLFNEAYGVARTPGGQLEAGALRTFGSMVGMPSKYADEIASIGSGDAKSNSTTLHHRNGVPLADVSINPRGFYTVTMYNPDGSVHVVSKDKEYYEAVKLVNRFEQIINK